MDAVPKYMPIAVWPLSMTLLPNYICSNRAQRGGRLLLGLEVEYAAKKVLVTYVIYIPIARREATSR
jgi:hypothetical protein